MDNYQQPPKYYPICAYQEDLNQMNEIIKDQLYLSGYQAAVNEQLIKDNQITHIVNIMDDGKKFQKLTYLNLDEISDDIDQADKMETILEQAYLFIDKQIKNKKRVLVHCAAGISRSATLVLYYLMKKTKKDLLTCFIIVREKRKIAWPNQGFMQKLIKMEQQMFKKNSIKIEDYNEWTKFNIESYEARIKSKIQE